MVAQTGLQSYEIDIGGNVLWSRHADQIILVSGNGTTQEVINPSFLTPDKYEVITEVGQFSVDKNSATAIPSPEDVREQKTGSGSTAATTGGTTEGPQRQQLGEAARGAPAATQSRTPENVETGTRTGATTRTEITTELRRSTRQRTQPDRYQATM